MALFSVKRAAFASKILFYVAEFDDFKPFAEAFSRKHASYKRIYFIQVQREPIIFKDPRIIHVKNKTLITRVLTSAERAIVFINNEDNIPEHFPRALFNSSNLSVSRWEYKDFLKDRNIKRISVRSNLDNPFVGYR